MQKTTEHNKRYWKNRVVDWKKQYFDTWNHPHRGIITNVLFQIPFVSLWEVGVGGGANLMRILHDFKQRNRGVQLNGCDVNEDAVAFCKETFKGGEFYVNSGDDMLISDKSVDVLLSDMTLIYVSPRNIDGYMREFRRVARNHVVLCEFHSKSLWKRILARWRGYHVYDYVSLLERHGFFNVMVIPIPESHWPGADKNTEFRSVIVARVS